MQHCAAAGWVSSVCNIFGSAATCSLLAAAALGPTSAALQAARVRKSCRRPGQQQGTGAGTWQVLDRTVSCLELCELTELIYNDTTACCRHQGLLSTCRGLATMHSRHPTGCKLLPPQPYCAHLYCGDCMLQKASAVMVRDADSQTGTQGCVTQCQLWCCSFQITAESH